MKNAYIFLVIFLFGSIAYAQTDETIIEIKPTKKIIHVENLGMSGNTAIMDALNVMPELLERGTSEVLANYSIQIDGKDVGSARDVVLNQTILAEVDVIEVSTSPTVSEQKSGTGGVINIKLRPVVDEGISGLALLDASTAWNVQPSVFFDYKKKDFTMRTSVMLEYYEPTQRTYSNFSSDSINTSQWDTIHGRFWQETAKIYLTYQPTAQDELKIHAWESYGYSRKSTMAFKENMLLMPNTTAVEALPMYAKETWNRTGKDISENLIAEANIQYTHKYRTRGKLQASVTYHYTPSLASSHSGMTRAENPPIIIGGGSENNTTNNNFPHQVTAEVFTENQLLKPESDHELKLKVGANSDYSFGRSDEGSRVYDGVPVIDTSSTHYSSVFASPYVQLDYTYLTKVYLSVGARYQFYRLYTTDINGEKNDDDAHAVTANASLTWLVQPHHKLRFSVSRNILRSFNYADNSVFVNPCHNAELNYIFDWKQDDHTIVTSAGLHYIHTVIRMDTTKYAKTQSYIDHVANLNYQLLYQYRRFSLALAGNFYAQGRYPIYDSSHFWGWYYNLSLTGLISLRKYWTLSGKVLYNSKIKLQQVTHGDCIYTQFRVAKQIGNWNIHAQLNNIFGYTTRDYTEQTENYIHINLVSEYELYPRSVSIGFTYSFDRAPRKSM